MVDAGAGRKVRAGSAQGLPLSLQRGAFPLPVFWCDSVAYLSRGAGDSSDLAYILEYFHNLPGLSGWEWLVGMFYRPSLLKGGGGGMS